MRKDALFIAVEVDDQAAADTELARRLTEACPVDIYAQAGDGTLELVEQNLDECVLCRLCLDASPQSALFGTPAGPRPSATGTRRAAAPPARCRRAACRARPRPSAPSRTGRGTARAARPRAPGRATPGPCPACRPGVRCGAAHGPARAPCGAARPDRCVRPSRAAACGSARCGGTRRPGRRRRSRPVPRGRRTGRRAGQGRRARRRSGIAAWPRHRA